jgi:hypothetical protein
MKLFTLLRPARVMSFPLIRLFVFTGEPSNGWRCESCLTSAQRRWADPVPADRRPSDKPFPGCCRKCGLSYFG